MDSVFVKILAGALIPSFATMVFNLLSFFFERHTERQLPEIAPSTWDIASGCVFSIIGICVTAADQKTVSQLLVTGVILILVILAGDLLIPAFLSIDKLSKVVGVDVLAFGALVWSIVKAG